MGVIIDLYSKFLIAFVGIVTPALALYLNSYFINRTRFEKLIETREILTARLIELQEEEKTGASDVDVKLANKSNEELTRGINELNKWKEIVNKLDPKEFFKENVKLLALSMTFLFAWLSIRTFMQHEGQCYYLLQIMVSSISVGSCLLHIINLYKIGIYLIDIRPQVEDINVYLKDQEKIKTDTPNQIPNGPEAV